MSSANYSQPRQEKPDDRNYLRFCNGCETAFYVTEEEEKLVDEHHPVNLCDNCTSDVFRDLTDDSEDDEENVSYTPR